MLKFNFLVVLFSVFISASAIGQSNEMSEEASSELVKKVIEKSKNTNSIISDFEQYKHMDFLSNDIKSTGVLTYKTPSSIKWEYRMPFNYSAIFKENKIYINDAGVKSKVNLDGNKIFKSLNKLIIKSIKGDMFDEELFDMTFYQESEFYIVRFKTLDSTINKIVSEFVLTFDKNDLQVIQVQMIESTNDYTLLKFRNQLLNQPVSDEVFSY